MHALILAAFTSLPNAPAPLPPDIVGTWSIQHGWHATGTFNKDGTVTWYSPYQSWRSRWKFNGYILSVEDRSPEQSENEIQFSRWHVSLQRVKNNHYKTPFGTFTRVKIQDR